MKISVVMATYNGEKYLDQQLQSILNQTRKPDEIIVCDDRSTDSTASILERYQQQGLLRYYINPERLGVIGNFKRGVSLATEGYYISLSDQDDEWMADKLEKTAALMQQIDDAHEPRMVYSDLLLVDENFNVINPSLWNEVGRQERYKHNLETLLFNQFVNGCATLLNPPLRDLFSGIPDVKVRFHHDDWFAVAAFAFGRAESIKEPLIRYRKHDNNVTVASDLKPRSRYRSLTNQLRKVVKGEDDFLAIRFELAQMFYDKYAEQMKPQVKQCFESFLKLKNRSYFIKKLAFRRAIDRNLIK